MTKPLPPSVAVLLGLLVGVLITVPGMYFYSREHYGKEQAQSQLGSVVNGEKAATVIREEHEVNVLESSELSRKVESGEQTIVTQDGARFTADFSGILQRKLNEARAVSDSAN